MDLEQRLEKFYSTMERYDFLTPNLAFPGEFFLTSNISLDFDKNTDLLWLNSKVSNGQNMYEQFYKRYYLNGITLKKEFSEDLSEFNPIVKATLSEKTGHRILEFDYLWSMLGILYVIFGDNCFNLIPSDNSIDPLIYTRDYLREARKHVKDAKINGSNSPYYNEFLNFFNNEPEDFKYDNLFDLLTGYITTISNFIKNRNDNPEINIDQFKNCFDVDKLYLLIAKSLVENERKNIEKYSHVSSVFPQLQYYVKNIFWCGLDKIYKVDIKWYNPGSKKVEKYSVNDLLNEILYFNDFYDKNDYVEFSLKDLERMKLGNAEHLNSLLGMLSAEEKAALEMSWSFIQPGDEKTDVKVNDEVSHENDNDNLDKKDNKAFKMNESMYHKFVLDRTKNKCKIVGKEKFAGYIGYIYDNGLVVFEKIYKDNMKGFETKSNATYIMNFVNFAKFTKLDKQELIHYIKSTDNPEVKRVYHSKKWENKIISIINGLEYNDEINQLIDAFIETQHDYKFN